MRVRFWGTRGSIPKPGPTTIRYGGNTSCVEVQTAGGTTLVFDCGTGAMALGAELMRNGPPAHGHLLISHAHWDHIQGLPFFAPLFVPGNEWDVYAPHGFAHSVRETLAGQMQHTYFPVDLDQLGATIRYHDLTEGVFTIGDIEVRTRYLNHPALTLGYRLEADGVTIVYCCDHEPHSRPLAYGTGEIGDQDREHIAFIADADLLIHDAQYRAPEYEAKMGWGHSTLEYAVAIARAAEVKNLAFTHHDPWRDDATIAAETEAIQAALETEGSPLVVRAAAEGESWEFAGDDMRPAKPPADDWRSAELSDAAALADKSVLLGIADPNLYDALWQPLQADGIRVLRGGNAKTAVDAAHLHAPSLIVLERYLPGGGLDACRAIRDAGASEVPVIIVASHEDIPAGTAAGVTDWLIEPFSRIYARSRMRAWLMRTNFRWTPAPLPPGEAERLAALHQLAVLDTGREERFDRLTRIAAAAFDVPVALVSLVDANRQWFKSTCGTDLCETARDVSFCAHAILERKVMVVPDALLDQRFADNPVVVGEPRVRFYAGCPLVVEGGACIGTLCLLDTRPRQLDDSSIRLLEELAGLVLYELQHPIAATWPGR
ncbi:MAG TPA: MBL fold metallo-hydrolase [Stellaceae bacterium]|nr:MBL fold metallo-hydrolase [Stellaceae bacterium]